MTDQQLLHLLYELEKPILQKNAWPDLRIRVADVLAAATAAPLSASRAQVLDGLCSLRLDGHLMFLPDWEQWEKDELEDEQLQDSRAQWEPVPSHGGLPDWKRRKVFMPEKDELGQWFVRSRVAETARLLYANRERFGLEASTAHLGYELQPRLRPDRTAYAMADAIQELQTFVEGLTLPRRESADTLKLAIQRTGVGLGHSQIAAFQVRAWKSVLRSLFEEPRQVDTTMITAGVSSGKTYSFLLPLLTLLVYRALRGEGRHNRALIIYPRTSLVEDQYHGLHKVIESINAQLTAHGTSLTDRPALDAGQLLGESLGVGGSSLGDSLHQVRQLGIEVILTTTESLKNRMMDPRAVRTYLKHVEVVVFDEIHLMEGLAGSHGISFVRRMRQLMRSLRKNPGFEPAWIGASATVAEPVAHAARVLSISDPKRIQHVAPAPDELIRFGTFHHLFLHTRVGKASLSAVTNGVSCLVHTRNDSTAHAHYENPSAPVLKPRKTDDIRKTIVFVDSLSTIGRLDFTTADNERTYDPQDTSPPYYSWFYRPAARLNATAGEEKSIKGLQAIRRWCQNCYHGIPDRIDPSAFQAPELTYLRTHLRMDENAKARATPPGLREKLAQLPQEGVRNLDGCPFHEARLCWWFSQDSGQTRQFGNTEVRIDQNRAIPYTSKTDAPTLHDNVNDYFLTEARQLWRRAPGIPPKKKEAVSTMLASPRIEVGVDFRNVRDGATHKAMRSASAFQQKIGRVGREDGSDSVIVTFLAHRPTDAHFAHQPARLLDAAHLDPIPLKADNPDVLSSHLFAAALEFIASRPPGTIPNGGHELNIIGTGSPNVPSWENKVDGCIQFLTAHRDEVLDYMLAATGQGPSKESVAEMALDRLLTILGLFVTDLGGAYAAGRTLAHWFKENQGPAPDVRFVQLLSDLESVVTELRGLPGTLPTPVLSAADTLLKALDTDSPTSASLAQAVPGFQTAVGANVGGMASNPTTIGALYMLLGKATNVATALGGLSLSAPLARVREAHSILQAFFETSDPGIRRMQQYYLHDLLTRLTPFRQFYPFGLVRTHFQHVNAREVTILLPTNEPSDSESLSTALYELLPGTWNYRWVRPLKSPSGPINQMGGTGEHFIHLDNIVRPNGALFEPTRAPPLAPADLPADMPVVSAGTTISILRPVRLRMESSVNQPDALFAERLIADGDEAQRANNPADVKGCPTVPRAFPATWYRVETDPKAQPVRGKAAPGTANELPHTFPAIGRVLLDGVTFATGMKVDRYVYAIDRSYGNVIESPRIHYRHGPTKEPVVLGDTLGQTDGLTFRLRPDTLEAVIDQALGAPGPLRGELTVRAMRRFIARTTGCSPFQSDMIRKVLLMGFLDQGGTLSTLDFQAIQTLLTGLTSQDYDRLSGDIIQGMYAGADPNETATARSRQVRWHKDAWPEMQRLQASATDFDDTFIEDVARDILIHTLAVTALDGVSRLVGATDGDLSYFHQASRDEFYIFDSVEGGNGCAETVSRYLQIPPLQRIVDRGSGPLTTLPSSDGFMLIEEALAACPAQASARLLFEASRQGVTDVSQLSFPRGLSTDLEARMRHEYDSVVGAHAIVSHLIGALPQLFSSWWDLLWLQLVPERFSQQLVQQRVCAGTDSLRSRTHLCITGCLECVNNGDGSIYGSLTSHEHVSKNLLDVLRRHVAAQEPGAFLGIASGSSVGAALQAHAGQPVTDATGNPVTAVIDDNGTPRRVLLTQVLSTVSPDLGHVGGAPLLSPAGPGVWDVNIPFLASYRDERPLP
ncbi:DEAD/DEAH box helicase [Myxococcus sp. Y35]|uniref:DEAD/DEAH box helicase n=1 Tax=Pseudomyxococcus flavus TaxID=3115648 RepID=UPI003CF4E96E